MPKKDWICIPFRCPDCGFQAEAYILDTRPYNPLLAQLKPGTELRCGKYNGKDNFVGCGWSGELPKLKN